jgi:hypothetical protein
MPWTAIGQGRVEDLFGELMPVISRFSAIDKCGSKWKAVASSPPRKNDAMVRRQAARHIACL